MARILTDELLTSAFVVGQGERQVHKDGMPIFNGSGEPKMEPVWVLIFTHVDGETKHVLKIPFDRDGRDKLVEALTGGIAIASQIPGPGPIEL